MRKLLAMFLPVLFLASVVTAGEYKYREKEHNYNLQIGLGAEVQRTPYKSYDIQWGVAPVINFDNKYLYIQETTLGGKFINLSNADGSVKFTASAFATYDDFSFDPDDVDDQQLKQLKSRHSSVYAGLKLSALTPYGLFETEASHDLFGHGNGMIGNFTYYVRFNLGPLEVFPKIGFNWANRKYNKYYYGITDGESARSGLAAYTPKTSFSPFVGAAMKMPLGGRWEALGDFEVSHVAKTIRNSPMVDKKVAFAFKAMVGYNF